MNLKTRLLLQMYPWYVRGLFSSPFLFVLEKLNRHCHHSVHAFKFSWTILEKVLSSVRSDNCRRNTTSVIGWFWIYEDWFTLVTCFFCFTLRLISYKGGMWLWVKVISVFKRVTCSWSGFGRSKGNRMFLSWSLEVKVGPLRGATGPETCFSFLEASTKGDQGMYSLSEGLGQRFAGGWFPLVLKSWQLHFQEC